MKNGRLITVEGIEGAGKSTVVGVIRDWLESRHIPCVLTREPGGTPVAEAIRQILLSPDFKESIQSETELLLMFAGRAQHISEVVAPALAAGKWVVSDRYLDASYAYQGGGRGLPFERIQWLEHWIAGACQPELTFLLDLPPAVGLARAKKRGPHDRIEQERLDFFERVRAAYLIRAGQFPDRIMVVDALQSAEEVQALLLKKLAELQETSQNF